MDTAPLSDDGRDEIVQRYLGELDAALQGLPAETAAQIRAGIAEELSELGPVAARERIEQLGDPLFIADAARSELDAHLQASTTGTIPLPHDELVPEPPRNPPAQRSGSGRGFTTRSMVFATSAAVAVGGFLIPLVGWAAGIALMWLSPVWRRWEKLFVTLFPFLVAGLSALIVIGVNALTGQSGADGRNPLMPAAYDFWHLAILVAVCSPLASGIWLLVRGLRRVD